LIHLTHLNIENLSRKNLLQLGGLTNLQELCVLDHFTEEVLDADNCVILLGPRTLPGLAFPASLTKLLLLDGVDASILSLVPPGLKQLHVQGVVSGPDEGPESTLSCMAGLQQLTQLDMLVAGWDWSAGSAFSALTASSSLVSLSLTHNTLPKGVWPHVFSADRQLLHLTYLGFAEYEGDFSGPLGVEDLPSTWGAADLSCLVSCCPNLHTLHALSLHHGLHVSELHKLTGLSSMYIHYAAGGSADLEHSIEGLAAVTQLGYLGLNLDRQNVEVASLLPLTSLTCLTTLECCLEIYKYSYSAGQPQDDSDDVMFLEVSSNQGGGGGCLFFPLRPLLASSAHAYPTCLSARTNIWPPTLPPCPANTQPADLPLPAASPVAVCFALNLSPQELPRR
jgi:hypothetical protein